MDLTLKFLDSVIKTSVPMPKDDTIEKIMNKDDLKLQRKAAEKFASQLVDAPVGASPATMVNHALVTFFAHGYCSDKKLLKKLGKDLKALTKMGVNWNSDLVPFMMLDAMGLPKPNLVESFRMATETLETVCEAKYKVKESIGLRAEVWGGRTGRLKIILKGHEEVGYVHRPGPKGTWRIYQDIGENAKLLAKDVSTKELRKAVQKLFGGDEPEKVVVETAPCPDCKGTGFSSVKTEATGKPLPKFKAGSPIFTNAQKNRDYAMQAFKAGLTPKQIADEWPEVFKLSPDGKLGQKYDYEIDDNSGRYETNRMITQTSFNAVMRKYGKK